MPTKLAITIVSTVVYAAVSACFAQPHHSFGEATSAQHADESGPTSSDQSLENGTDLAPIEPGTELNRPSVSGMDDEQTTRIDDGSPRSAPADNWIPSSSFTPPALMPGAPDANSTIAEVDGASTTKSHAAGATSK